MIKLICKQCRHEFYVKKCREKTAKFCCKKCYGEWEKSENNPNWRGGPITLFCDWCGEEIKRSKGSIYKTNFCNRKCHNKWKSKNNVGKSSTSYKSGPITLICEWCGHEYTRNKAAVEKSRFCSNKCYSKGQSADKRGILYEEWEAFASESPYCPLFNNKCRESNREKYGRKCFLCDLLEEENITSAGKHRKLSVHHVDMDKMQGCDGKRWKLIPTCIHCHGKVHNELWQFRIMWLLENVWNKD